MVVQRRLRRPFAVFAALALVITAIVPAAAQDDAVPELGSSATVERGEWNSYIVVMKADPLVVTEGRDLATNQARNRGQQLKESHNQALQAAGIDANKKTTDYVNALNGFSALITYAEAVRLSENKDVAFVIPDELMQLHTDSSPTFIGLDVNGGAWDSGVTGQGVVVGVIDTGIWPEHPSFADNGLPAPPVTIADLPATPTRPALRGCDFGNTAHNANDVAFACNNKLIGARQVMPTYRALIGAAGDEFNSARDDNGHGTHTASTAAGNAGVTAQIFGRTVGDGPISGIAPDAHVVAYKGLGNLGGFGSDLALAIDTAVADGVDVINYSVGGSGAAVSADEIAFLFAAEAGVHVATSAGNTGPAARSIFNPGKVPWLTTVGANTQSRFLAGTIELGNEATFEGASVTLATDGKVGLVDAATAAPGPNGDLCISAATGTSKLDPAVVTGKIVLCRRGTNARIDKSLAVLNAGGVGMIMYENDNVSNLFTDNHHVPTVHIDNAPGLTIKAYIASAGAGATAEIRDTGAISTWPSAPSMTSFSSRGPSVFADVIKPDVTAPGLQVLAGASPFPDAGNVTGQLFQAIAGTSMSSPHVAGLFALLDQAHPEWSAAAARSALMTTANPNVRDNDRTTTATPFGQGSGLVNPGRVDRRGSSFAPGLVYEAGLLDYLGFLCDAAPTALSNPNEDCPALAELGVPTDASDLNYPSIAVGELAGSQTVTRTVTSVAEENAARTYTVSVQAPPGYAVTVSPSTLTLRRGESATYEVAIVNQSGPVNEWRFGSLTWTSQTGNGNTRYDVRSPIALRAAAFDAPDTVSGEGESGTASFNVKFGYTGEYDATSHGLVPATQLADNVVQDPNQSFSRTDAVTGGADEHQFVVTNAEVFRVALPPESTAAGVDLDLYVFRGTTLVGSSGAPDTDETVTIIGPPNATYFVYVHGWLTPGGSADYTLSSWIVSAPGSLAITAEPADAVLATTGTIDLSWSGATAGQWHLGAVRHTGPGGALLGRTLVEVDNR